MVQRVITQFGKIDIVVNQAGTGIRKPLVPLPGFKPAWPEARDGSFFTPTSEKEWHYIIDTNLTSIFLVARAIGPHMIERRKGKIIYSLPCRRMDKVQY